MKSEKFKKILIGVVALFFILFAGENALACKCINPPSVEQSFEQSSGVFYGTVESVESSEKEMVAVFRVEKSWKGADNDKVIVRTDTTSCGINFRSGEAHYLFVDKKGDEYFTVICRRHGGTQEKFLENKPTITLKSIPLDKKILLADAPKIIKASGGESGGFFSRDMFLIAGSSIVSAVFVLAVAGVGFYIFKSRKR